MYRTRSISTWKQVNSVVHDCTTITDCIRYIKSTILSRYIVKSTVPTEIPKSSKHCEFKLNRANFSVKVF